MTDQLITRLVVGEPTTVAIGRPVGQRLGTRVPSGLRWASGSWVGARTPRWTWWPRRVIERPRALLIRSTTRAGPADLKRDVLAVALFLAAAGTALAPFVLSSRFTPAGAIKGLPIEHAAEGSSLRIVAAAYEPPAAAAEPAAEPVAMPIGNADGQRLPPLPVAPPVPEAGRVAAAAPVSAPASKPAAAAPLKTPAASVSAPAAQKPESRPAPKGNEQQPPSAVVLDEAASRAPVAQQAAQAASSPASQALAQAFPPPPSKAASGAAPIAQKPTERGTGLIAITPDAKVAVFTNPKTRLPQQFKVGDQLPGGDTIRSIDAKEGRVVSTSKEYTLD